MRASRRFFRSWVSAPFVGLVVVAVLALGGCPPAGPVGNSAPIAEDSASATPPGESITIALSAGDANGDTLTYTILSLPSNGTLADPQGGAIAAAPYALPGGGSAVSYAPAAGFSGSDTFTFEASDGQVSSDAATVTVTVAQIEADVTYDTDTTLATLTVESGRSARVSNNAVITVTGDATIDGTLFASAGRIRVVVGGELTVNGTIRAMDATAEARDDEPLSEQTSGIQLVIGTGAAVIGPAAALNSDGPIVITDSQGVLARTPAELFDEVEDVSGDDLPTLVPLPPENAAVAKAAVSAKKPGPNQQDVPLAPLTVGGTWPPAGAPAPRGDRPILILRFEGPRDVNLNNWTVNGPAAPAGTAADQSENGGTDASGARGRNGLRLNLRNEGGSINIVNGVTLNLAGGGDGGSATAVCASATGGAGGESGNFRITAAGGIDISAGTLTINPGRGGNGGSALVDADGAGAAGCAGETGRGGTATGGAGGRNTKTLFARGNVSGLENVAIGAVTGGNGGDADVTPCEGGPGLPCCDGGVGGAATAVGGAGGAALLSVGTLGVTTGAVTGGNGGAATAFANRGGDGGNCKLDDGGDGGSGGAATATGGAGGASTNDSGPATGGNGGDATAYGGDGGDGGDGGLGDPGLGGGGGTGRATQGAGGVASTAGQAGVPVSGDGIIGLDGEDITVVLYCFDLGFLVQDSGLLDAGTYEGVVTDIDTGSPIGSLVLTLTDDATASYSSNTAPVGHIGISGGVLEIDVASLSLEIPPPGVVSGLQIMPLFATNVGQSNPVLVEALGADGVVLDSRELESFPNNSGNAANPEPVNVEFDLDESISTFRIVVAPGGFLTLIRVYLVDP